MPTVDAIVLLGWLERDAAVKFLVNECVFDAPLSEAEAERIWEPWRVTVEALPERLALAPERLPIDSFHAREVRKEFLNRYKGAKNILDVIRIDPMGLVVHQLWVITDRSGIYRTRVETRRGWLEHALLCNDRNALPTLNMRAGANWIDIEIPHAEFILTADQRRGIHIQQLAGHVNVTEFGGRMMLWAGYHRSYARMLSIAPDAMDRSLLVTLTTDGIPGSPNQGERTILTVPRPPLFGDFFDARFFMNVKFRKRRFELRVRAQIVPVDET